MPTNRPPGSNAITRRLGTATHTLRSKTKAAKYRFGVLAAFSLFAAPAAVMALQSSSDSPANLEPSMHTESSQSDPAPAHDDTTAKTDHSTSTDIIVNGQQIPIPDNGTSKQRIQNSDGSAVDVTVEHNNSDTATTSSSYTSLKVDSTTERSANEDG